MTELRPFDLGELNLDTIAFERLVTEARGQIPRFAADWTDHNLHDPGMTLIDLLGWIVDQQIYRLGFVSDRHLAAFAALLGQRPVGPKPASGLVWSDRRLDTPFLLAAGKPVLPRVQPDVGFVLGRDVLLSDAKQVSASVSCGDSEVFLPLRRGGPATSISSGSGSMLVLNFDRPLVGDLQGPISVGFDLGTAADSSAADPLSPPWGPLRFDYQIEGSGWVSVQTLLDETAGLTQTGTVFVDVPAACGREGGSSLRLRLDEGFFPLDIAVRNVAVNVLPVVQLRSEPARELADGNGMTDQSVAFDGAGLVDEPVIEVDGEPWETRPNFCDSGPADLHYVRSGARGDSVLGGQTMSESGEVTFGNGVNGRRPGLGASIVLGEVKRTAGEVGNLRADVSWTIDGVDGWSGRNCDSFSGGSGPSTIDDLLAAARRSATERDNLLTNVDLAAAARRLSGFGVSRAEVISGYDPDVATGEVKGTRSLVVFPERPSEDESKPVPFQYLQAVDEALETGRVLGERLLVISPQVFVIDVEMTVTAEPGTRLASVEAAVAENLSQRLSVLDQNDGVAPWNLGRAVTVEELKTVAADTVGVMFVSDCGLAKSGESLGLDPIELKRHGLAVAGDIRVVATTVTPGQGGKRS